MPTVTEKLKQILKEIREMSDEDFFAWADSEETNPKGDDTISIVLTPEKELHVYMWLEMNQNSTDDTIKQVYRFLDFKTMPASHQFSKENINKVKGLCIFCEYDKERYRITGASRLGDIFLSKDLDKEIGYDTRVFINQCSNFSYVIHHD